MTVLSRPQSQAADHLTVTIGQQIRAMMVLAPLAMFAARAHAVDGCLVLLCLAAPSWRAIPQCVPPIRELFRDLARGRPFPTCAMAGAGNGASHRWASVPDFCPPQYIARSDTENSTQVHCDYAGAVSVSIRGEPFARTWWRLDGEAVTEFSPAAKAQLGTWDRRFDDDYAAWLATRPPVLPDPTAP